MTSSDRSRSESRVPLWAFFVLLFSVSWIGVVPMVGTSRGWLPANTPLRPLQILMLTGPLLVALSCAAFDAGRAGVGRLLRRFLVVRARPIWYLAALVGPALLCLAVLGLFALSGGQPPPLSWSMVGKAAGIFAVYLVVNTEEVAWRGYAQPRLQARFGERRTALGLGVLWASFHLPLFALEGGHPAGYAMPIYLVMLVGLNVIFTRFYSMTGASLLLVHLLHQSFNGWAEAIPFFPLVTGSQRPVLIATALTWVVAAIILWSRERSLPPDAGVVPAGNSLE